MIDLRSDTVTRPGPEMRRAMAEAEVGDDQYGEDPTVRALEERYADLVGKAAAMLVPSGTMANQVALRMLGRPGTSVVAGRRQHVVVYEHGAAGLNSGTQLATVDDTNGIPDPEAVAWLVAATRHHQPEVSAIFLENTHLAAGGRAWPPAAAEPLLAHDVPRHLDGARLFNAAQALGCGLDELAAAATTVMSCLSKGLGAPVGSLLAGPAELVAEAREQRQRLGGGMRQAGVLAAAGLVALDRNIDRLVDDHRRARRLADAVAERWPESGLDPESVQTNIVVFSHAAPGELLAALRADGVLADTIAPGAVRLVTHLDVDDVAIDRSVAALRSAP